MQLINPLPTWRCSSVMKLLVLLAVLALFTAPMLVRADEDDIELDDNDLPKVDAKIGSDTTTQTDSETLKREAEVLSLACLRTTQPSCVLQELLHAGLLFDVDGRSF
jgi:hypothetical protein